MNVGTRLYAFVLLTLTACYWHCVNIYIKKNILVLEHFHGLFLLAYTFCHSTLAAQIHSYLHIQFIV